MALTTGEGNSLLADLGPADRQRSSGATFSTEGEASRNLLKACMNEARSIRKERGGSGQLTDLHRATYQLQVEEHKRR